MQNTRQKTQKRNNKEKKKKKLGWEKRVCVYYK